MMTRAEALARATIYYIELPMDVHGAVMPSGKGRYIIAINSTMTAVDRARALEHELAHIRLDHFHSEADTAAIEAEADALIQQGA